MNTKLTLTLEKEVIENTKIYAKKNGQSLSDLVENYFKFITRKSFKKEIKQFSKKTEELRGVLKVDTDFDYKKILKEEIIKKHG